MSQSKEQLITIGDIHFDLSLAKKRDGLNKLLSHNPPVSWVKDHPLAKNVKYLPIERIEYLLTKIYQVYSVEVMGYKLVANSITVHVRLKVIDPVTGEPLIQDGVGAVALQTDKGAGATDFDKIKSDAVMKALPAAESFAIKDAAEKFGNIFGANLNRKDIIGFSTTIAEDYYATSEQIYFINSLIEQGAKITPEEQKSIQLEILRGLSVERAGVLIDYLKNPEEAFVSPVIKKL